MPITNCIISSNNRPYTGKHGLYVHRPLVKSSAKTMVETFAHLLSMKGAVRLDDLHCTTMYSEVPVPDMGPRSVIQEASVSTADARIIGSTCFGAYFVLLLSSNEMKNDNFKWVSLGAEYSHPEYKPHMTLIEKSTPFSAEEQKRLIAYVKQSGVIGKSLEFGPEIVQDNSDS